MEKIVIIAFSEEGSREYFTSCIKKSVPGVQVFDGSDDKDFVFHLKNDEGGTIFFDKYFLSYNIKEKVSGLRLLNPNLRFVFCEEGERCSKWFGYRLRSIGADGFISHIDRFSELNGILRNVLSGKEYYPKDVLDGMDNLEHLDKKFCSEITPIELDVCTLLGEGKSIKEVGYTLGKADGTISSHLYRIKHKSGCNSLREFAIMNSQLKKHNLRSWKCL